MEALEPAGSVARLVVRATSPGESEAAARLAARLGARLEAPASGAVGPARGGLVLQVGPDGLTLLAPDGRELRAAVERLGAGRLPGRDLLARAALTAARGASPAVVDATAGLGADGFRLAALGHRVVMLEREPLLALLLEDALGAARAGRHGEAAAAAAGRVDLHRADARDYLGSAERGERAAVVYLDPMFPERGKSALPAKAMALMRQGPGTGLVGARGAEEERELLRAARAYAARRVVVKRPLKAPPLAGEPPSGSLKGSSVRFDLYAPLPPGQDDGR